MFGTAKLVKLLKPFTENHALCILVVVFMALSKWFNKLYKHYNAKHFQSDAMQFKIVFSFNFTKRKNVRGCRILDADPGRLLGLRHILKPKLLVDWINRIGYWQITEERIHTENDKTTIFSVLIKLEWGHTTFSTVGFHLQFMAEKYWGRQAWDPVPTVFPQLPQET